MSENKEGYSLEEVKDLFKSTIQEHEAEKTAERERLEEQNRVIEERADELANERAVELLNDKKFWEENKAPVFMQEAKPGSEGKAEEGPVEAFRYWARTGDVGAAKALTPGEEGEAKNLLSGSGSGTYLVPDDFVNRITELRDKASFVRSMGARVIQTNLPKIDIPTESTSVANFGRTAEAGAYTTDLPAFAQNQVTTEKWTLRHTVSEEFLADDAANFDEWYTRSLGRSMAKTESYYVAIGSGTNQHTGIFVGGDTDALTFDSSATIEPQELLELFFTLKSGYRSDAAWLMNSSTWLHIAGLRDADSWAFGAADMLTIDVSGGPQVGTMYGKPVFNQDDIDAIGTGVCVVMVGSPAYYALVERKGFSVSRNPWLQQANGLVDFFSSFRQGGTVLAEEAWVGGVMA